jgi:hypothetical protein
MKCKKYEAAPKTNDESSKENVHSEKNVSAGMMPNFFQGSSSMQYGFNPPFVPSMGNMYTQLYMGHPPFLPFPGAIQPRYNRNYWKDFNSRRGRCLYCKDLGHFVADCPKIKKE